MPRPDNESKPSSAVAGAKPEPSPRSRPNRWRTFRERIYGELERRRLLQAPQALRVAFWLALEAIRATRGRARPSERANAPEHANEHAND
jgi:hypothetical protein